jgi:hypothetical protein
MTCASSSSKRRRARPWDEGNSTNAAVRLLNPFASSQRFLISIVVPYHEPASLTTLSSAEKGLVSRCKEDPQRLQTVDDDPVPTNCCNVKQ